jgi:DNA-binding response OmpR family regulator
VERGRREAWVEAERLDVTDQDFDLLLYLFEHAGEICSRDVLVRDALGSESDNATIEDGRLNSAMSRLRQKVEPATRQKGALAADEGHTYLETVKNQGYRLQLRFPSYARSDADDWQ